MKSFLFYRKWILCLIPAFFLMLSLPEYIVVPVSLADQDLKQYSSFFTDNRIPVSIFI